MKGSIATLALLLSVSAFARGDEIDLTTAGSGSVTISSGYEWTDVTVKCWGGGGGGGGYSAYTSIGGAGGGGGAYAYGTYATLLSGSYDYYIGAGGSGGTAYSNGSAGGSTIWNYGGVQDINVTGGGGGYLGGLGGSPGLVIAGTGFQGGEGGDEAYGNTGGGGGSAGPSGSGGNGQNGGPYNSGDGGTGYAAGGVGAGYPGAAGTGGFPGGGGGGGGGYPIAYRGAAGGNGEIIITYTQEAVPEPSTLNLLAASSMGLLGWARRRRAGRRSHAATASGGDESPAVLSFPSQPTQRTTAFRYAA